MMNDRLVDALTLAAMIEEGECLVFDCRFDLVHPEDGRNKWLASHIPGAVYAHLEENLSSRVKARSGRHPLPTSRSFALFLARSGYRQGMQVVAYDASGGAFAARLWWLMRYFGLGGTAVLDGGISAWRSAMLPLESGTVHAQKEPLPKLELQAGMALKSSEVQQGLEQGLIRLVDARDAVRFEGRHEPIDSVAGHIPGAVNHPFGLNLQDDRRFKPAGELKASFKAVAGKIEPGQIVHMCGSGVTACQNILAMELAGIKGTRLYHGSWSEWIRSSSRPVATGTD